MIIHPTRPPVLPAILDPIARGGALPWDARAGGGAYDPAIESGLALDLFAEKGTTLDGSNGVSPWVDQKGGVSFSQSTAGLRLVYTAAALGGRPALVGNGDGLVAAALAIGGGVYSMYLWCDVVDAATEGQVVFDSQTGRLALAQVVSGAVQVGILDGSWRGIAAPAAGPQCLIWRQNSSTSLEVKRGGTSLGTTVPTGNAIGAAAGIGGNFAASGAFAGVKIGRLMIFTGLHDAATEARIRAWGVSYYGVAA